MIGQQDVRAALAEAIAIQKSGDSAQAARLYRGLLEKTPDLVPALCLLANLERKLGDFSQADNHLKRALELAPDSPAALQESGLLALATERPEAAIPYLRKLVAARPGFADGQFNLGHALELANKPQEAIGAYRAALEHGVKQAWEAQTRIGSCLTALGREQDALAHFDQALALAPDFAAALFGKGMVKMAYGDFEQADRLFQAALRADPERVEIYQQLVELKKYESMDEPLVRGMQALLETPGGSEAVKEKLHFALGKVADDCGEYAAAFQHYSKAKALKKARQPPFDRAAFSDLVQRIEAVFTSLPDSVPGLDQDRVNPVFIIGMPRSGTTLVEQILSCHSSINGAGELSFMEALSRRIGPGYPEAVVAADQTWKDSAREAYLGELLSFAPGANFVTDKYPANFLHVGLIATLFPQARFIHCRRNPLGNSLSIFFQDFSTGNYYANDLEDIGFYYSGYAQLMRHWQRVCGGRIHSVQYEDMVDDQEKQTRGILEFLGLAWEAECLHFHKNPRKISTMSRWQVRQPVYSGSRDRWRHYAAYAGTLIEALPAS